MWIVPVPLVVLLLFPMWYMHYVAVLLMKSYYIADTISTKVIVDRKGKSTRLKASIDYPYVKDAKEKRPIVSVYDKDVLTIKVIRVSYLHKSENKDAYPRIKFQVGKLHTCIYLYIFHRHYLYE